jgi:uncharacterized protein YndB with AHSA1/START domain
MTQEAPPAPTDQRRLEQTYNVPAETVWELWTTAAGIEEWWSPDGFVTEVRKLDLRPGGELIHALTATAPEQVEFMLKAGMPLTNEGHKTFTAVEAPTRLAYLSLIDFVPGKEPYPHLTVVDLEPAGEGVRVVMTVDALHDDVWTQRLLAGRANELDNLAKAIARRRSEGRL